MKRLGLSALCVMTCTAATPAHWQDVGRFVIPRNDAGVRVIVTNFVDTAHIVRDGPYWQAWTKQRYDSPMRTFNGASFVQATALLRVDCERRRSAVVRDRLENAGGQIVYRSTPHALEWTDAVPDSISAFQIDLVCSQVSGVNRPAQPS